MSTYSNYFYDTIMSAIDSGLTNSRYPPLYEDKSLGQAKSRTIAILRSDERYMDQRIDALNELYNVFISFGLHGDNRIKTKFIPVLARIMILELGFGNGNHYDFIKGDRLKSLFVYISQCPISNRLSWTDFDGYHFDDVEREYGQSLDREIEKKNFQLSSFHYEPNDDYQIIPLHNLEEARRYAEYTGDMVDPDTRMCYAQYEESWYHYTQNGNYSMYVCLRKDWKRTPCFAEDTAPYDRYGLSMIFVIIDAFGEIAFSNTRWNHLYGDGLNDVNAAFNDYTNKVYNELFLCRLLGCDYHEVLRPFNNIMDNYKCI